MNDINYINQLIANVCNAYSIDVSELNTKCNESCYVMPRYCVILLLKRHCGYSYKKIKQFVNKDHSTMIHALKLIDDILYTKSPEKDYQIINELLKLYSPNEAPIDVIVNNREYKSKKEYELKKYELNLLKKYEKEVIRIRKKYGISN